MKNKPSVVVGTREEHAPSVGRGMSIVEDVKGRCARPAAALDILDYHDPSDRRRRAKRAAESLATLSPKGKIGTSKNPGWARRSKTDVPASVARKSAPESANRRYDKLQGLQPIQLVRRYEIAYHFSNKIIDATTDNDTASAWQTLGRIHLLELVGKLAIPFGIHVGG